MNEPDPHNLQRFVTAQAGVIEAARREIEAGRKQTHWMWFVFPQLKGLGVSATAQTYGLASLAEARAYLAHPLLGARLRSLTQAVIDSPAASLHALFGTPDDLKFRSSMTLFDAAEGGGLFRDALARWCGGETDPRTLALLRD